MSRIRNIINSGLDVSSNILSFSLLKTLTNQKLILPFYHAVSDEKIPHIKNLYHPKSTKEFSNDLEFLLKHYEAIDYSKFREVTHGKATLKKPSFLLSFDDGLSEFNDIIAPILFKKGIPAICFLNSGFVDNKDLFFRYKASILIEKLFENKSLEKEMDSFFNNSKSARENILSIGFDDKNKLDEIANLIDYNFNDYLKENKPYLETEQINNLIKKGFHFGAHSVDHPEYQYISKSEQIEQTKESINFVTDTFNLDYRLFSFPFTDFKVSKSFFDHLSSKRIIDFTFGTAGIKKDSLKTNFQRIPFEKGHLSAKEILKKEFLYYLLKMPLNKNTIQRN